MRFYLKKIFSGVKKFWLVGTESQMRLVVSAPASRKPKNGVKGAVTSHLVSQKCFSGTKIQIITCPPQKMGLGWV